MQTLEGEVHNLKKANASYVEQLEQAAETIEALAGKKGKKKK